MCSAGGHHRMWGRVYALGYRGEDGKFSPLFFVNIWFRLERAVLVEGLVWNGLSILGRLDGLLGGCG